jgi:subtilisin family serine protease
MRQLALDPLNQLMKDRGRGFLMIATIERFQRGVAALIVAGLVAGCQGGGGGGGSAPSFSVGGNVNGLAATGLSLVLNGAETLNIGPPGGAFNFTTLVQAGSTFSVTIASQPSGETCAVDNGGGAMPSAQVTVTVTCSTLGVFSIANAAVTNPLVSQQWHLLNTAQTAFADAGGVATMDINVDPAFGLGYTGVGVTVAVVDTGLEIAHEDLSVNVITNGSWNFNTKTTDPTNTIDTDGDHGTSVAGLIAMVNNNVGGIGVAPRARLKGFNLLSAANLSEVQFLDSIGASNSAPNSSDVAVFNQSFGVSMTTPILVDPRDESQYATATAGPGALRGGKGAVYVKAAGNGFFIAGDQTVPSCTGTAVNCVRCGTPLTCENANFDPDNTLPYQIVVGAMNASGVKASYSTAGSAIWVSAPGGEFGRNAALGGAAGTVDVQPAMVTTDQSGCTLGLSRKTDTLGTPVENGSFFDDGEVVPPDTVNLNGACKYTNGMNGTSSATPVTTGVIALMLEANPALTWRDVKHILASTAVQIDAGRAAVTVTLANTVPPSNNPYIAEPAWTVNHAMPTPFHYHNWYGFGLVDAGAAVSMAKTYSVDLGTFTNTGFISSPPFTLAIPNLSATGTSSTISVPPTVQVVEAVQIRVSVTHPDVGELGIELTSPAGTRSVLKNITDGYLDSPNLSNQIFLSNAFYGENPAGIWTIKVVDGFDIKNIVHMGTLTRWAIRVYGH